MKFLEAIKAGKTLRELEELEQRGELEDINFKEENSGKTALYYAVESGNKEIIDFFLRQSNCEFDTADNTGRTPFTWVVFKNKIETVEHLLKNKKFRQKVIKQPDGKKQTALDIACLTGNLAMFKLLVENGAYPMTPAQIKMAKEGGFTTLMFAVSQGQKEIVNYILNRSAVLVNLRSRDGNTALLLACLHVKEINLEIVSLLLENHADPFIKNNSGISFVDLFNPDSILENESEKKKLAEILLKNAIKRMDAKIIFKLKENPVFKEAYERLSQQEKEKLGEIMTIKEENVDFFTSKISEFSSGSFGKITYGGGLLTIIQTNKRKKTKDQYIFNPTLLKNVKEFSEYLEYVKKTKKIPLRERFVISGSHWICGDILINKDGRVHVLFMDSLGTDKEKNALFTDTGQAVLEFQKKFPEANIYLDKTQRQNSSAGCSVYALDDVRHLYTIEKYLEPKYKESGLFGYLSDNRRGSFSTHEGISINDALLPLPFMRTTQSSSLYRGKENPAIISSRSLSEQLQPLGKNKGSAKELQASLMKEGFKRKSGSLTKMNERLKDKLESMCEHNFDCLLHTIHSQEEFDKSAREFTLEGFKERIEFSASKLPEKEQAASPSVEPDVSRHLHYSYSASKNALTSGEIHLLSLIKNLQEAIDSGHPEKEKIEQLILKIKGLGEEGHCDIDKLVSDSRETLRGRIMSLPSEVIREQVLACFRGQSPELRG